MEPGRVWRYLRRLWAITPWRWAATVASEERRNDHAQRLETRVTRLEERLSDHVTIDHVHRSADRERQRGGGDAV